MIDPEHDGEKRTLGVSVAVPRSPNVRYFQELSLIVSVVNKTHEPILVEEVSLRFQSDVDTAAVYVSQPCGLLIEQGLVGEQRVKVCPTPRYLAYTNIFDVMVCFRGRSGGRLGERQTEIH